MYAIMSINGDQVKVEKDTKFTVNRLKDLSSKTLKVEEVLFAKKGNSYLVGDPTIKGAYVECEVLRETRGKKVIAYKYRDRKSSQSIKGHRQDLTELKVVNIELGESAKKSGEEKKAEE
ncbi:MAG: 50S ribosomal protein L21 [Candidatus Omnitrophica bacterium]|nr:50S ribosomal protein L21 [Candidatus Omnitrophota bacterium]MDD5488390.1 50S ribosomal protein L21 [Candidatus Omnitrophota bacterium]